MEQVKENGEWMATAVWLLAIDFRIIIIQILIKQ